MNDEKEMNEMGDNDIWSEYFCNRGLTERTDGVFTRGFE